MSSKKKIIRIGSFRPIILEVPYGEASKHKVEPPTEEPKPDPKPEPEPEPELEPEAELEPEPEVGAMTKTTRAAKKKP